MNKKWRILKLLLHLFFALLLAVITVITYNKKFKHHFMVNASVFTEKTTLKPQNNGFVDGVLPIIHYLIQDKNNPLNVLAASSYNAGFSGNLKSDKEIVYWMSTDFGKNWAKTDSSIFEKWELADSVVPEPCDCRLRLVENSVFINKYLIRTNYDFISETEKVGLYDENHYFFIGKLGVQLGRVTKKCFHADEILWTWGLQNDIDSTVYNLSSMANYCRMYDIGWSEESQEIVYKTKEYEKVLSLVANDSLRILIPSNRGGLFCAELPLQPPLTFRRLLYFVVENKLGMYLNLLFIIYLAGVAYKN